MEFLKSGRYIFMQYAVFPLDLTYKNAEGSNKSH